MIGLRQIRTNETSELTWAYVFRADEDDGEWPRRAYEGPYAYSFVLLTEAEAHQVRKLYDLHGRTGVTSEDVRALLQKDR